MKICLINQPAGIGDIFFLQYVARKYLSMGYKVIWPLQERLLWIKDHITDIDFCILLILIFALKMITFLEKNIMVKWESFSLLSLFILEWI